VYGVGHTWSVHGWHSGQWLGGASLGVRPSIVGHAALERVDQVSARVDEVVCRALEAVRLLDLLLRYQWEVVAKRQCDG
jgi:hypothetical protein